MGLALYINFKDESKEAIDFYSKVFNTNCMELTTYSDIGNHPVSKDLNHLVVNAKINIHGTLVMISDVLGVSDDYNVGNNITIVVDLKDEKVLTKQFNALKEDGKVIMDLGKTFFSEKYGFLYDKFGIGWQFNLSK